MNDRVNLVIASMRRKKLSRSKNKTQQVILDKMYYSEESISINEVIELVCDNNNFPTIQVIKKELVEGIKEIYEHHNFMNSVLSHNCCFEFYLKPILELIEKVMNKEYIYSHKSVKRFIEGSEKK